MNSLGNFIRKIWLPEVQQLTQTALVGKEICNFLTVADGQEFHKPYHSDLSVGDYTRNATSGAVSQTDITTTDEYLTLNTIKFTSFYIDKFDKIQMFYQSLDGDLKQRAAYQLAKAIDSSIMAEYANAGLSVDAGDVGGTSGQAITLALSGTNGNILDVIQKAKAKLAGNDVNMQSGQLFLVVDSNNYYMFIERYLLAAGYKMQDQALANGYVGTVSGVNIYISNNLATSTVSGATAIHWLAGQRGATTLAVQTGSPEGALDIISNPMNTDGTHRLGTQYVLSNLFGKKTFTWDAKRLVDIKIHS